MDGWVGELLTRRRSCRAILRSRAWRSRRSSIMVRLGRGAGGVVVVVVVVFIVGWWWRDRGMVGIYLDSFEGGGGGGGVDCFSGQQRDVREEEKRGVGFAVPFDRKREGGRYTACVSCCWWWCGNLDQQDEEEEEGERKRRIQKLKKL